MTTKEILAQRLSQLREEAKISRQKAANDLGISRNSLEYYEKGKPHTRCQYGCPPCAILRRID